MKKLYCSLSLLAFAGISAQQILWQKDLPSATQDFLSIITTTIDGHYLVSGSRIQAEGNEKVAGGSSKAIGKSNQMASSSLSPATSKATTSEQNHGYDFHIVKLSPQGDKEWEKTFAGQNHDFLSATVATQEGGFLLAGTSYSPKGGDKKEENKGGSDIWLIRINEFGDELWQKTLGTASDDEARSVIQTTDLGYIVAGNIQNAPEGYGSKDVSITRLDKNGKETSQILLGGSGLDEIEKIIPTKDGGALLGIYSRSGMQVGGNSSQVAGNSTATYSLPPTTSKLPTTYQPKTTNNEGEGDYWIVKLNKDGKVEWQKNYGGKGDDHLRTLSLTTTGYLIGGESRSERPGNKTTGIEEGTDLWLVALNERGEEQWQKSYSFNNRDILMSVNVIRETRNKNQEGTKGFLLGGYTQAEGRIEKEDETFWMLYLNENGEEVWRKHIEGQKKKKEERLSDLKINRDGTIVLAGTSAEELGKENWKIVKLGDKMVNDLIEKQDIKIYPNPVGDYCYVEIGLEGSREQVAGSSFEAEIMLYDMSGKLLQQTSTKNRVTKINTQPLVQGAYLVTVKTNDNQTANAKIIKK